MPPTQSTVVPASLCLSSLLAASYPPETAAGARAELELERWSRSDLQMPILRSLLAKETNESQPLGTNLQQQSPTPKEKLSSALY